MKKEEQLRMLLHPEKYTDEQLAQMLDETRVDIPDVNEEWQRLTGRIKEDKSSSFTSSTLRLFNPTKKIAAIFIGLLMLSGITYAAIHIVRNIDSKPQTAITERKPDVKNMVLPLPRHRRHLLYIIMWNWVRSCSTSPTDTTSRWNSRMKPPVPSVSICNGKQTTPCRISLKRSTTLRKSP